MQFVLFNPQIEPCQVQPFWARVDLGVMAMKECSTFPKNLHHWSLTIRLFSAISRTLISGVGSLTTLQRCNWYILQPQPTKQWTTIVCIYIYTYSHSQSDCLVVSQLISGTRHARCLKLGSKPGQLYVSRIKCNGLWKSFKSHSEKRATAERFFRGNSQQLLIPPEKTSSDFCLNFCINDAHTNMRVVQKNLKSGWSLGIFDDPWTVKFSTFTQRMT